MAANRELIAVIEQIGREKGIESHKIITAVEAALQTAAKKRYGAGENIQVRLDPKSGEIEVISLRTIVNEVSDPKAEISIAEARKVDGDAEVGDEIGSVIEMEEFGRIAAQTAKQVIFQRVREAEWEAVYNEYSGRQGEIVTGMILGQERRNYIIELGTTEALLPASEQVSRESYRRGDRIRALLLEVKPSAKGPQIILSRATPAFVEKLFHLEVPEVAEGIVQIKGVVREPGDRTKVAVASRDAAVDPVGACVGVKGSRVQSVVRELRGEKIDIIAWTTDLRVFIGEALSPAMIDKVGINEAEKSALVVVNDQQLSLAIGKRGQNVRLAAKLTGWKIDIMSESEYEKERSKEREREIAEAIATESMAQEQRDQQRRAEGKQVEISDLAGVGDKIAEILVEGGFDSIEKLAEATEDSLEGLSLIGRKTAEKIISEAKLALAEMRKMEETAPEKSDAEPEQPIDGVEPPEEGTEATHESV